MCANSQLLHKEAEHIREGLARCKCTIWALNRPRFNNNNKYSNTQAHTSSRENSNRTNNTNTNQNNIHVEVPYTKGLSKSVKNISGKVGIQVHFNGGNTRKSLLVTLRKGTTSHRKVEQYTGTSVIGFSVMRSTNGSLQWPLKKVIGTCQAHSSIYDHANTSGDHTKLENFSIVGRQSHTIARAIKEAMFIRASDPFQPSIDRQHFTYYSLQETYPHWPVLADV